MDTPERLFKVLNHDGTAYHGGRLRWPLPNGQPGDWHTVTGPLIPCENGLHLCRPGHLVTWLGPAIFLAEADGEQIDHTDKLVVRRARLLSRVETWNDQSARLFAVTCARRALERERLAGREPDVRSWRALDVATAFAHGVVPRQDLAAAWAAAWDAARAAAGDAERQWQTQHLMTVLFSRGA